ncbi:MAG: M20/M25/M40 family metallo-hydrolase [Crocinitomicaceae bacterium]|nr:M20/M25/M40 family metallo-hydrolase [Crocinitomicaceae bacterium]
MRKKLVLMVIGLTFCQFFFTQRQEDKTIRRIYDEALLRGHAYEDLRSLCKDIGPRLSGSAEAAMSIRWSEQKMRSYGFDRVYLEPIMVPHWERGNPEAAWITHPNGMLEKINICALGGSVSTQGMMEGTLVMFNALSDLIKAKSKEVSGKIVFINQPMNAAEIQTFKAYGACYPMRGNGAIEASKLGAKAVLIRSLGLPNDDFPHTGSMRYEDSIKKIPAAALSTQDAERIADLLTSGVSLSFSMEMDCRNFPDEPSFNVIGELLGSKYPTEVITIGGHLDSWDQGEGAHDDGAGVIHCMEALRILKTLDYKPKHTIRVVFFMNEENGNMGGKSYAKWVKEKNETHLAALESDRGGFTPRGFGCDASDSIFAKFQAFAPLFEPYDLHLWERGGGGVDIGPLKEKFTDIALFGFVPDGQRYFDVHHAESDVFETVNKRELELGAAAIASLVFLMDTVLF